MRRGVALVVVALAASIGGAPARADSGWQPGTLTDATPFATAAAFSGPGEITALMQSGNQMSVATRGADGQMGPATVVQDHEAFLPAMAGSALSGAVGAWYDERDQGLTIVERRPGGPVTQALHLASFPAGYSEQRPQVAVTDTGRAAVAYTAGLNGRQVAALVVRGLDGQWSAPQIVAPDTGSGRQIVRSVAISQDGEAVVGFLTDERAHVAIREPTGTLLPAQTLGEPNTDWSWSMPQVGIDALGNAVALWGEDDPAGPDVAQMKVAFRPARGAAFGAPQPVGAGVFTTDAPQLAVSAPGEVALVVDTAVVNPNGGGSLTGLHAAFGSTVAQRLGPLTYLSRWTADYPSLALDERGDGVFVAYDTTDPGVMRVIARRRKPLGPWGAQEDALPPITFSQSRYGRLPADAQMDLFGNAMFTWTDGETSEHGIATSSPWNADPLPGVSLPDGFDVAPVLPQAPATPGDGSVVGTPALPVVPPTVVPPLPVTLPGSVPVAGLPGRGTGAGTGAASAGRAAPDVDLTVARATRSAMVANVSCSDPCAARVEGAIRVRGGRWSPITPAGTVLHRPGSAKVALRLPARLRRAVAAARRHGGLKRWSISLSALVIGRDGASERVHVIRPLG